jgi:hypothetical protein
MKQPRSRAIRQRLLRDQLFRKFEIKIGNQHSTRLHAPLRLSRAATFCLKSAKLPGRLIIFYKILDCLRSPPAGTMRLSTAACFLSFPPKGSHGYTTQT